MDNIIPRQPSCKDDFDEQLLSVAKAEELILNTIDVVSGVESVSIRRALGRTLAEKILSKTNVPPHTNSAMDGYAINAKDLPQTHPATLKVVGTAYAGHAYHQLVDTGQCVRIMTGAVLPKGTDTVIIQERVERVGDEIRFDVDPMQAQNVRQAGEDLAVGQVAISAGKKLNPAELGLLASMGIAEVKVYRKPRVAFFSTGDELRSLGDCLTEGEIYDSNRYTLHGMLSRLQVDLIDMGVVADNPEALRQALIAAATDADVVITTGGVSVGEADYIKDILAELGRVNFWKLAIKPGRPLAFGKIKNKIFFGLPGNPVAVMVTFYQFAQLALKRIMGQTAVTPQRFKVPCVSKLKKQPGRMEFCRGTLNTDENNRLVVCKAGDQGSGILSSMSKANCFIVLPAERGSIEPEQIVEVEAFDGLI